MTPTVPTRLSPPPARILLIRPSALGDVCRSVPVLVSLKRAYPEARIDWLVQDAFAEAVAHHPDLHRVVPFPRRELAQWWKPPVARAALRFLSSIRSERYDLVLDCQGLFRSGVFARATRAPLRIGYANAQELGWLGYTRRIEVPRTLHTVDRMLALAEAAGAPPVHDLRLYPPTAETQRLDTDPELARCRFALLAPTSRWPGKRWPIERFASLAEELLRGPGSFDRVVVVGSRSERDQCELLLDRARARPGRIIDRIGATTVGGLMAIIQRAALVVANDSAALHMAIGLNRPAIGLYGPTNLSLVGPYGCNDCAIQHITPGDTLDHKNEAAGQALMERISVEEVRERATHSSPISAADVSP